MRILSKICLLVIFFSLIIFRAQSFCQTKGYKKVDKISLIKKEIVDPELENITEIFFSALKNKDFGKVYELIPVKYKEGVSKEVFINAFDSTTVENLISSPWIEISDFSIKQIEYIDDKNANVEMLISYKDMFSGVKEQPEIWLWNKQNGVWLSIKLYSSLMDKARWFVAKQGQLSSQEIKKDIVKQAIMDEVHTQRKKED